MSEPTPDPQVLIIDLGAPERSDDQPVCASPSSPLPISPTLYLRMACTQLAEHEGPHLWTWVWADIEEAPDGDRPA